MGLVGLAVPFGTLTMYFYHKNVFISKVFISTRKIFLKKIRVLVTAKKCSTVP